MFKQREVQIFRGRAPELEAKGKQSNKERPFGLHAKERVVRVVVVVGQPRLQETGNGYLFLPSSCPDCCSSVGVYLHTTLRKGSFLLGNWQVVGKSRTPDNIMCQGLFL